jgi:RimJ/RimL family protein N-acetyltransferase
MNRERHYPDEPSGPFEAPPVAFEDREGRRIEVRAYTDDDREPLVEMYTGFDPSDRAQGIPPSEEPRIRTWLDQICGEDCLNVLAWDDAAGAVAGHATLVPDGDAYELAIFVLQAYQRAGIGTRLIEALLGYGAASGIEKVWLTVERWNHAAVALYEKVGFETSGTESFEKEMAIRLATD